MGPIIAGAMQGAGEAGVAAGLQAQRQYGQEELLKMKVDADQALAETTSRLAVSAHAQMSDTDIGNIPRKTDAETAGEVKKQAALAPGKREQATFESDLRVKEKGAEEKATAELTKVLGADKDFLKAKASLTAAGETSADRARAAEAMSNVALHKVQLAQAKTVAGAHDEYNAAVATGDQSKIDAAKTKLDAAMYDMNAERAQQTANASVIRTMTQDIDRLTTAKNTAMTGGNDAEAARIQRQIETATRDRDALQKTYNKAAGVKETTKPAAPKINDPFRGGATAPAAKESEAPKKDKGIVAGQVRGYGETLDQLNPRKPRESAPLTEEDRMMTP